MKPFFQLLALLPLLTGCEWTSDGAIERTARDWAEAYFNYDFIKARKYTTAESCQWLNYAASNMTEGDISLWNEQDTPVEVSVTDVLEGNDTMAIAIVDISYWLAMDSIGQGGNIKRNGRFTLNMVKRNGRWLVKMAGLPQSERQSRD